MPTRSAATGRGGDVRPLSQPESLVLMCIAYFQPITRGELSSFFGKEVSRDLMGVLRRHAFIASEPRSQQPGAPYTYVTTKTFLSHFGFDTLRDMPDFEALEDAGLLSKEKALAVNVLSRLSDADIRTDPFPHLVIQDALDAEVYAELAGSFPSPDMVSRASSSNRLASNRRYSMPAWSLMLSDDVSPAWKRFLEQHTSPDFFRAVRTGFEGHWDATLAGKLEYMERTPPGLLYRDDHSGGRILLDARVEINSPVVGPASSARGAHLDTPNRVFSGLFYLRAEDDDSTGGELELFRWKAQPPEALDVYELPVDAVERVAAIPYRPNQLVMFPQSIDALHGVGIRHPTSHIRRYVFITAEIEEDWLTGDRHAAGIPGMTG